MNLITAIDALLPQTQCGKCGHPGCHPYAEAIAQGEPINRCPPGGRETIGALAQLLERPLLEPDLSRGEAPAQVAYIREAECIGCTKCIQACPVDAIIGAARLMHTVLTAECTGCDLCVAPCPVDCIDMLPLDPLTGLAVVGGLAHSEAQRQHRQARRDHARTRHQQRNARLAREEQQRKDERQARLAKAQATQDEPNTSPLDPVKAAMARIKAQKAAAAEEALKKAKIDAAMTRAHYNRALSAFGDTSDAEQAQKLLTLRQDMEQAQQRLEHLQANP